MTPEIDSMETVGFERDLYRLLSALLLAAPTQESVDALADPATIAVVQAWVGKEVTPALGALAGASLSPGLCQEFFDVLRVPTSRYVVPFESVYCDDRQVDGVVINGLLAGPSERAVRRQYAAAGFELAVPELADHAGCELAFLAALLGRAVESADRDDLAAARESLSAASRFARAHPARWFARLADRMRDDPKASFYPTVVGLGAAMVTRLAERSPEA